MAAIVLLLGGGFLVGLGWLAGVVLLWTSAVWTTRDKVVGTLFVPGGLALPFILELQITVKAPQQVCKVLRAHNALTTYSCRTIPGTPEWQRIAWDAGLVALVVASIAAAAYLYAQSRRAGPGASAQPRATVSS